MCFMSTHQTVVELLYFNIKTAMMAILDRFHIYMSYNFAELQITVLLVLDFS